MQVQLTQSRLRELLDYSPETGVFTNRITRSANAVAGTEIKCLDNDGYVQLRLDGVSHKAHRLAWFYMTGQWPRGAIDHINGLRNDNRFSNLRDTTLSINSQNMRHARSDSKSGLLGASFDKSRGKYVAQILVGGIKKNLGRYGTAHEAHQAYLTAKRQFHEGSTV